MPQTVNRNTLRSWTEELETVGERIAPHFSRSELRRRAQDYLRGLLSGVERKNGFYEKGILVIEADVAAVTVLQKS